MKRGLILILFAFSSFIVSAQGCLKLDVVLVVDMSSSIQQKRVPFIVNAVLAFANRFELSEEGIKISIVKFNDGAVLLSPLSSDRNTLLRAIGGLDKCDGNTSMDKALELAANEFMTNGRQGFSRIVVLITDGEPNDKPKTFAVADLLKTGLNTKIFGIFVDSSNEIDQSLAAQFGYSYGYMGGEEFLQTISSPNCYLKSEYEMLITEIEKLDICF